jgi:DNA-binding NtrC family response regulator
MYGSILIAHRDRGTAQALATALHARFPSVRMAGSLQELEAAIPKYKADAVVCDLETVDLDSVNRLAKGTHIIVICTHRVPDEAMWIASLEAGATDCCAASDPNSIVSSLERNRNAISRAA